MPRGTSRPDEAAHQRRLWTPALLRGRLQAWYDAQALDTVVRTTTVSQWKDRSGRGFHLTTATTEPGFSVTAFNGNLPGLVWSVFSQLSNTAFNYTGAAASCFAVATRENGASRMVGLATNGAANDWDNISSAIFLGGFSDPDISAYAGGSPRGTAFNVTIGAPFMATSIFSGTDVQIWKDGTATASTAYVSAFSTSTHFRVGGSNNAASEHWLGKIGEVVILNSVPAPFERQAIEGYLAWHWALAANLPASHPYRNAPPLIGC